jgi:hypothetical protein
VIAVKVPKKSVILSFPLTLLILFGCDTSGDNSGPSPSPTPLAGPIATTIYDIQGDMFTEGTEVTLTDVIVTSPIAMLGKGFFVEDTAGGQHSGLFVYVSEIVAFTEGESITITGSVSEYYGFTEVLVSSASDITVTGNPGVPDPEIVDAEDIATSGASGEAYEGVLVSVEGVSGENNPDSNGEWAVTGGLIIDDLFYAPGGTTMGTAYASITGCLYSNNGIFKLEPRDASDIQQS